MVGIYVWINVRKFLCFRDEFQDTHYGKFLLSKCEHIANVTLLLHISAQALLVSCGQTHFRTDHYRLEMYAPSNAYRLDSYKCLSRLSNCTRARQRCSATLYKVVQLIVFAYIAYCVLPMSNDFPSPLFEQSKLHHAFTACSKHKRNRVENNLVYII